MMFLKRFLFRNSLEKNEQLIFSIHRHWLVIKNEMLKIGFFGYLLPLGGLLLITGFSSPVAFLFYAWLSIAFLASLYAFFDWYLDAWLVTNVSIIETEWNGPFRQRSSRIEYTSIESVDVEKKGILQAVFNYGHIVLIKSSGVNITMENVSKPHRSAQWISTVHSEVVVQRKNQNAEAIKDLLSEIIQDHIKVNS